MIDWSIVVMNLKRIKYSRILIFLVVMLYNHHVYSKDYDGKIFICADEVGPRFELKIPILNDEKTEKKISIKIFNIMDRDNFTLTSGYINKKSSPIDRSYFYYSVDYSHKKKNSKKGYFELYPPSHLMLRNEGMSFTSLVCW